MVAKSIAFLNMKGGVGKTTLAVNVACVLAKLRGKKVLLIDLDPQYNATQYLVNVQDHLDYVDGKSPTVFTIMSQGQGPIPAILGTDLGSAEQKPIRLDSVARTLYHKDNGKLDLIPGTIQLIWVEIKGWGTELSLHNFVKDISESYDYIIIDCPPTFGIYLLTGILASDHYVVPVKPDFLSILGVDLLDRVIAAHFNNYRNKIEPLGVVFTMVRNTREMNAVQGIIINTMAGKKYVFQNSLGFSTTIAEATRHNKALFEYSPAKRYGRQAIAICDELTSRLK